MYMQLICVFVKGFVGRTWYLKEILYTFELMCLLLKKGNCINNSLGFVADCLLGKS